MRLYFFRIVAVWVVGAVVLRTTLLTPQVCPVVTVEEANAAALAAAEWIVRAQQDDGRYVYEYNRETDVFPDDYNVVRHAGVTMSLYHAAASGMPQFMEPADRGQAYMDQNMYRFEDWAAFRQPGSSRLQLGSSSLMLVGLAFRRMADGDERYDELMRETARFLVTLQRPDGSFLADWDTATKAPVPTITSKYATGEAFWALALMHDAFPGEGWDESARLVADYLSTTRDDIEGFSFPPWADQWAAYGLMQTGPWGLNDENVTYARALSQRFGLLVRAESQRTESELSKKIRGRQARAAGMGTWVEALSSLWRLSGVDPQLADLRPAIAERAACGIGMLVERQQTAEDAADYARPDLVLGAWFTDEVTRMDDQQHALSALLFGMPALAEARE